MPKWTSGVIVRKQVWSEGLFTISIAVEGVEPFEAGQYLQLGLQLPEKHLFRPYSVASPFGPELDFFIVRVDGGALTPLLWNLEEGDSIDVSQKGVGSFTLSHVQDTKCLWLIGTGTGIAPYIAMLRTQTIWERFPKIVLVHGVRYQSELAYTEELQAYADEFPERFRFFQTLSREVAPHSLYGRITKQLETGEIERLSEEKIDPETSCVMLCGNPEMLNEMEGMLENRGLTKQKPKHPGQIIVERYW